MVLKKKGFLVLAAAMLGIFLTACGSKESVDYATLRDVSFEGTELTILLGENKSTGCEWKTDPQDDSVIDYSVNRSFKLSSQQAKKGEAAGTLSAGFKGKGAGTSQIVCTTPVDWDGSGDGYTYIVTVTVKEDGTIESAEGVESETKPAAEEKTRSAEKTELTLESYFNENPDVLEEIKKSINGEESVNKIADVDVTAKKNTLIYTYLLKETYSKDQVEGFKADLEEGLEQADSDMKERIRAMEEGCGIDGVELYMEYQNGDGSKICGRTYK